MPFWGLLPQALYGYFWTLQKLENQNVTDYVTESILLSLNEQLKSSGHICSFVHLSYLEYFVLFDFVEDLILPD